MFFFHPFFPLFIHSFIHLCIFFSHIFLVFIYVPFFHLFIYPFSFTAFIISFFLQSPFSFRSFIFILFFLHPSSCCTPFVIIRFFSSSIIWFTHLFIHLYFLITLFTHLFIHSLFCHPFIHLFGLCFLFIHSIHSSFWDVFTHETHEIIFFFFPAYVQCVGLVPLDYFRFFSLSGHSFNSLGY
jgi:hypothetical protein